MARCVSCENVTLHGRVGRWLMRGVRMREICVMNQEREGGVHCIERWHFVRVDRMGRFRMCGKT